MPYDLFLKDICGLCVCNDLLVKMPAHCYNEFFFKWEYCSDWFLKMVKIMMSAFHKVYISN